MSALNEKHCIPCEGGVPPLSKEESERFLAELEGWALAKDAGSIEKDLVFKNFDKAMDFVNMVADLAEMENHHPDIHVSYNKVKLVLSTHAILGLSENDFILAAKIDGIRL
jgi:4a-hydroxytetrahydrobiopterin dehydratase